MIYALLWCYYFVIFVDGFLDPMTINTLQELLVIKFVYDFNPYITFLLHRSLPSSTCYIFTTRTLSNFFIANPIFTYPFPCLTCFTFTSKVGFCNSSFTCSTLTLRIKGYNLFLNKIALEMKSFKNFCSSSSTLLSREDIL